jgi:hypothetical protein
LWKIAKATIATRIPSNGLETAKQEEMSQPKSLVLGFLFMLIPQAAQHRYFTKREISFAAATAASRNGQRWR